MARKKKEEPQGGASWLNTFADLMNLLLCFFVLLFAMSSVDTEKYEQLVASFHRSFSIFSTSGSSVISDGQAISAGVSQLSQMSTYFSDGTVDGESEEESVSQFFHILGSVDQQRGCCEVTDGKYEITLYTSCCNVIKGIYYYNTYENHQISAVDMHAEDLESNKLICYPVIQGERINYQNK